MAVGDFPPVLLLMANMKASYRSSSICYVDLREKLRKIINLNFASALAALQDITESTIQSDPTAHRISRENL